MPVDADGSAEAPIAHFGTFDVANYGDLLFPLILERRLAHLGRRVVHVSPAGGDAVWPGCVRTIALKAALDEDFEASAVIVGGGHIVHALSTDLAEYQGDELLPMLAYPGLWLGAADLAARRGVPLVWNAPGIAQPFGKDAAPALAWVASQASYVAVRDATSAQMLRQAGYEGPTETVPDTAVEVASLWRREELDEAYEKAFASRSVETPERSIAFHFNSRYVTEGPRSLARRVNRICESMSAVPVLLALGPCHQDELIQREIGGELKTSSLIVDEPASLLECAACIGRSVAYFGSSLHGFITAFSFDKPAVVVANEATNGPRKFTGFLEFAGLQDKLAPTWEAAEALARSLVSAKNDLSARRRGISALSNRHWAGIERALAKGEPRHPLSPTAIARATRRSAPDAWPREDLFLGLLVGQAREAFELRRALGDKRRALQKLNRAYQDAKKTRD